MRSMTGSPAASPDRAGALDARLLALHGSGRSAELSRAHEQAAELVGDDLGRRFHLTHAWVFALEAGDEPRIAALESRLSALGALKL